MTDVAPQAIAEERAVLGGCILYGRAAKLAVKGGLRAEHFYHPRHKLIFPAILRRYLDRKPIDHLSLAADLEGSQVDAAYLHELGNEAVTDPTHYAERIIEVAERRNQWEAAHRILEAAEKGDDEAMAQALSQSQTSVRLDSQDHDREAVSREFVAHLRSETPIETFEIPWKDLMQASPGGFLRHHFVSLIGWSGYGKSILLDQMLTFFAQQGYKCGNFLTEMNKTERVARYVAAGTGINASNLLLKHRLSDPERERAAQFIIANPLPFDVIEAEDWSAQRIRQSAILNEYDVIAVDTVNNIPHRRREDFEDEIRTLASASKLAGCLTIGVFQLNQQRRDGTHDPPPSLRDIRETGLVEHLSDRVLALHIENQDGQQENSGNLRFLKCRGGLQGGKAEIEHRRGHFVFEDKAMRKARKRAEPSQSAVRFPGDD